MTVNYWKLRSIISDYNATLKEINAKKDKIMAEMGLNPNKNYTLDDDTETVTEINPNEVKKNEIN